MGCADDSSIPATNSYTKAATAWASQIDRPQLRCPQPCSAYSPVQGQSLASQVEHLLGICITAHMRTWIGDTVIVDTASFVVNVAAGICLLAFWFGYALLLPFDRLRDGVWHLAVNRWWVPINLLGVTGTVLASSGLILISWTQDFTTVALVSVLVAVAGLQLLGGNLAWESVVWPVLARENHSILAFDGPLYRSRALLGYFAVAGILFAVGYSLLGATIGPDYPVAVRVGLGIGAVLFAVGSMAGRYQVVVRSVGICMLTVSQAALPLY